MKQKKRRISDAVLSVLLLLGALFVTLPVPVLLLRSLWNGENVSLSAYADFFLWKPSYLYGLCNSFLIALGASAGTLLISLPAAYVFAKVPFRGRDAVFFLYILVMMMPFQATLLPQYLVSRTLSLYDTLFSLILPGICSPFAAFLLTQVMKGIPDAVLEAARLETDSSMVLLREIIVPAAGPGVICAGVLVFTEYWNAVSEPLILLESRERFPLAVLLHAFDTESGTGAASAAAVLFLLAPFLLFCFFEREIMEGLGDYRLK